MKIWTAKYGGFVSSIILNIKIIMQTFCMKLMGTSKRLFNTTQRNQDYIHEKLQTRWISYGCNKNVTALCCVTFCSLINAEASEEGPEYNFDVKDK